MVISLAAGGKVGESGDFEVEKEWSDAMQSAAPGKASRRACILK